LELIMANPWSPLRLGNIELKHRLAMASMTRDRSAATGAPTAMNADYYAQRASMGLVITEGTQPNDDGQGYLLTPGIYTDQHIAGWRGVTRAVRDAGGHVFIQLMHVGRIAHPANTPHHRQPVAPSTIKPSGKMFTAAGMMEFPEPRALSTEEVAGTVHDFARAAKSAVAAGADGVEIHGANGYLLHQFLSSNANRRTDQYGGSVENRARFAVEVATAIAGAIGPGRVGFRISPGNKFNDIVEDDVPELYEALVSRLAPLGLAYLHHEHHGDDGLLVRIRSRWPTSLILNHPDANLETRLADIEKGRADMVSIGKMALANPDLVARIRGGAPLNKPDPSTFYGGDTRGYTDYPTLVAEAHPRAQPLTSPA
jgi:N-ethylmaleimide reductase